jgi:hypothetical protein
VEDPFLELAQGMAVVDRDWLSQVALAAVYEVGGGEGLSLLFTLTVLAGYLALGRSYYLQSGRASLAILGSIVTLGVSFSRLATPRPENFAFLSFALLLLALIAGGGLDRHGQAGLRERWPFWLWLVVPLLMALWANLHGSFPVGLALLGCAAAGRWVDVLMARRSAREAFADQHFQRRVWLAELGLAATLLNPYGIGLWSEVSSFSSQPNLSDIVEWRPLVILGPGGPEFALSIGVLLLLLRRGRRSVPASHGLLLLALALGVCTGVRFLTWYGPVFALLAVPLAAELWDRRERAREWHPPAFLTGRVRLVLVAVVLWVGFALSPAGHAALGGGVRSPEQLYGSETPLDATAFLRSRQPTGLAWAPQYWSDWLMRFGPPGFRTMVGSNLHLIPPAVWRDYMRVLEGTAGWLAVLDRYRIDVVFLLAAVQPGQIRALRGDAGWELIFEDEQAAIFARRAVGGG